MVPVPSIPETPAVGFATKLGVLVAALVPLLGALATVLDGDQTPEALGALAVGALAVYGVIRGRSDQAAAITEAKGQAHVAAAAVEAAQLQTPPATLTATPLEGTLKPIVAVPPGFALVKLSDVSGGGVSYSGGSLSADMDDGAHEVTDGDPDGIVEDDETVRDDEVTGE